MSDPRVLSGPGQGQQPPYIQQQAQWSNTPMHAPRPAVAAPALASSTSQRASRTRSSRMPTVPSTPQPQQTPGQMPSPAPIPAARGPVFVTATQALHSTYPSRMRTGATLLMQPILPSGGGGVGGSNNTSTSAAAAATSQSAPAGRSSGRRAGGTVNYTEPGSGDEFLDAGEALDSDDSDFIASGGVRQSIRKGRISTVQGTPRIVGSPAPAAKGGVSGSGGVDQSYLGSIPPARLVVRKPVALTKHEYLYVYFISYHSLFIPTPPKQL
jgi:chromatin structure-remodeling complex subunit SFH1